ncbi:uncharacterized protein IUM83_08314 [Phytophthora cinnamomi]|uniref:uncharacterized protein n=1 Tax=Phytophthora cinnamomi TaxID=4785 RepID=UPI00355A4A8C|nr:hypothetical protein IUM83_08314 [Phytophthora cinnamomi]
MVDIGFISELASILREFRFHTNLQVCVISILSALAEESPVYAYMMSEFDLEKLLQKTAAVHATQDRLVLLASNLVHVIEDSKPNSTEIAKEPPDPEALKQIQTLYAEGLQHQKENHLGLAIECYEKALAIPGGQSFASIHVNIGSALMAKNKFSEALESFEQAKRIQPNNIKAIYNYALALLHLDRPKEAQGLLRRILELDPTHEKASTALSHIQDAVRCPPTRS